MIYLTLFVSAFVSATLFPLGSEALFIYDLTQGHPWTALLIVAGVGNTLGSVVNYFIGLKGEEYLESKKILNAQKIEKYKSFFDRYGAWALLCAWMPIIGDPLTFIAGVLRYKFFSFFNSCGTFKVYAIRFLGLCDALREVVLYFFHEKR